MSGTQFPRIPELQSARINFNAAGDSTIVGALFNQTIRVYRMKLIVQGATVLLIKDGASTVLDGPLSFATNGGMILDNSGTSWYTTLGALVINSTNAVQVGGNVDYVQS